MVTSFSISTARAAAVRAEHRRIVMRIASAICAPNGEDRIERRHRILKDHADAGAAAAWQAPSAAARQAPCRESGSIL